MRYRNYEIHDRKSGSTVKVKPGKITKLFGHLSYGIARLRVGQKYEFGYTVIKCVG